jgi:hypothetical protein
MCIGDVRNKRNRISCESESATYEYEEDMNDKVTQCQILGSYVEPLKGFSKDKRRKSEHSLCKVLTVLSIRM